MGSSTAAGDVDVDIGHLVRSLTRKWWLVLGVSLAAGAGAYALSSKSTPLYRAEARMLIEPRESVFTRPAGTEAPLDSEGVSSQVEVISSSQLLLDVAKELDLASLEEFQGRSSNIERALVYLGLARDPGVIPPEEMVLITLREKLDVYRIENSRVIVIGFSSEDPELSARVPNAIADAYEASQRAAKLESNESAADWLAPQIEDLRERVRQAESKVAEFRANSNLLLGQNNTVLAAQQLSELSSELSRVRASRSASEARARTVRLAVQNGAAVDTLAEVQASPLIQQLRGRQVELRSQIADLSTSLMSGHPRIRALQSQLADLNSEITREARRILAALEAEAESARQREQELSASLDRQKEEVARAEGAQVELRALEREAASERALLESYATRFREAAARIDRAYVPVDARIFQRALAPSLPYYPKPVPMAIAAFVGMLLLMSVLVLLRELFSGRALRPAPGAGAELPVPLQEIGRVEPEQRVQQIIGESLAQPEAEEELPPAKPAELDVHAAAGQLMSAGVERVIYLSPEGDEAAAVSVGIARELADAGMRVLLLDLTISGAASLPMLESRAHYGITDLLTSEVKFADAIHSDLYSSCHVIPVGTADAEQAMENIDRLPFILGSLSAAYNVVMIECGPTTAGSIARLMENRTNVVVSVINRNDPGVEEILAELVGEGVTPILVHSPVSYDPPSHPTDRDAA